MRVGLDSGVMVAAVKRDQEKHHVDALRLAEEIKAGNHLGICSALAFIEIPGALASSTTMPLEKIYDVELSLIEQFCVSFSAFEQDTDMAVEMMLEFRELKRKFGIGSADFHHMATASSEGCALFVATDERHVLRQKCRDELKRHIQICPPGEALASLQKEGVRRPTTSGGGS
jgi:predicted nucleic acid-binding protein